jgi:hypothetical protein
MSAAALLAKSKNPGDDDIDWAMGGDICRRGTYPPAFARRSSRPRPTCVPTRPEDVAMNKTSISRRGSVQTTAASCSSAPPNDPRPPSAFLSTGDEQMDRAPPRPLPMIDRFQAQRGGKAS